MDRATRSCRASEILERIDAVFPLDDRPVQGGSTHDHVEPAERFRYADGIGDVGVIASVTEPFCEHCDRIRITAEGKLRTCLFALDEFDLRADPPRRRPTTRSTTGSRPRSSGGRHQVGRAPHRPGRLRPPRPVDEPDRRLSPGHS